MLLTMEAAYTKRLLSLPNPERVFRVNEVHKPDSRVKLIRI